MNVIDKTTREVLGKVTTNHSMTLYEALPLIGAEWQEYPEVETTGWYLDGCLYDESNAELDYETSAAAATLGRSKSPRKAASSAANGRKGGRPVVIYDTGPMSIDGNRERVIISKTASGISVKFDSLYNDRQPGTQYYRDYPKFPADWKSGVIHWLDNLQECYLPYRTK